MGHNSIRKTGPVLARNSRKWQKTIYHAFHYTEGKFFHKTVFSKSLAPPTKKKLLIRIGFIPTVLRLVNFHMTCHRVLFCILSLQMRKTFFLQS